MNRFPIGLALASVLFLGCSSGDGTRAEVYVDVAPEVKAAMAGLRLRPAGAGASDVLFDANGQLLVPLREGRVLETTSIDRWPVRVGLTPRHGESGRRFHLEAAAVDALGAELAVGRVYGTYRDGVVSYVALHLSGTCAGVGCTRSDQTCVDGACASAAATLLDEPPTSGGPDGGPDVTPCQANQICATVQGSGGPYKLLGVMLYPAPFQPEDSSLPTPAVRYLPVTDPILPRRVVVDLTQPIAGAAPATSYYVGIVAFASDADTVPVSEVDSWWLAGSTRFIGAGATVELGQVMLATVPRIDLADTPGDDRAGRVTCPGASPGNCAPCCHRVNTTGLCTVALAADCTGPQGAAFLACDGPEDCGPGDVCCGTPGEDHACVPADTCPARARACHAPADCPFSDACVSSTLGPVGHCDSDDPATPGDDRAGWRVCGSMTCDLSTQFCCDGAGSVCMQNGAVCSPPSYPKTCDGPEDCMAGQACCFEGADRHTCGASNCVYPLCHTDADCPDGTCDGMILTGVGGRFCN